MTSEPKAYSCTYCSTIVHVLPEEFRLCQSSSCIELAIKDREEFIFETELSVPRVHAQLIDERTDLIRRIAELEIQNEQSAQLQQYKSLLASLETNLGFNVRSDKVDQILVLQSQIKDLSKRLARPSFPDAFRRELWERDKRTCYLCKKTVVDWRGVAMHIDHVRPRSQGGSDETHNLRIAHSNCNLIKGDRMLAERRMKAIFAARRRLDVDDPGHLLF